MTKIHSSNTILVRIYFLTLEVIELYKAKVTSKGQITIPKELRDKIGIRTGSYIEIKETAAGYVISKHINENCLKKYVGILNSQDSSDNIIKELREE